jgi:hypothetical protein
MTDNPSQMKGKTYSLMSDGSTTFFRCGRKLAGKLLDGKLCQEFPTIKDYKMQAMYTNEEIKSAYVIDVEMIVSAFKVSEDLGKTSIKSAVSGFVELLTNQKGKFIPSMDLDYRRYIVGLLATALEKVDESHKELVMREIMFPSN